MPSPLEPPIGSRLRHRPIDSGRHLVMGGLMSGLLALAMICAIPAGAAPGGADERSDGAASPSRLDTGPVSASRADVSWSDTSVTAGESVSATVAKTSVPRGADLKLLRWFPDGWKAIAAPKSRVRAGTRFQVPTDQYGTFRYKVRATVSGSGSSTSSRPTRLRVAPGYTPAGKAAQHAFLSQPRWRWDSCSAITWRFNPTSAPKKGLRWVKGSLSRVEAATGLSFQYAGTTTRKPTPSGAGLADGTVIVGWRTPSSYRYFADNPKAVGVGGATYRSGYREAGGAAVHRAVTGGVVLNARYNTTLGGGFGSGTTWGEVVMHEIGHVMGLAHVARRTQLMYPSTTPGKALFGAGDLAGLALVGDTRGCLEVSVGSGRSFVGTTTEE